MCCAWLPRSSCCRWSNLLIHTGILNNIWSCMQSISGWWSRTSVPRGVLLHSIRQCCLIENIKLMIQELPQQLGWLFSPLHTHELLHDLDEVTKLVIGWFVLTSALSNNAMATLEMVHCLWAGWLFFRDEMMDALIAIEGLHLKSLTARNLYSQYQWEIYNWIYEYHPDTLKELQVAMEQLQVKHDIWFPGKGWPVEHGTEWMNLLKWWTQESWMQ